MCVRCVHYLEFGRLCRFHRLHDDVAPTQDNDYREELLGRRDHETAPVLRSEGAASACTLVHPPRHRLIYTDDQARWFPILTSFGRTTSRGR